MKRFIFVAVVLTALYFSNSKGEGYIDLGPVEERRQLIQWSNKQCEKLHAGFLSSDMQVSLSLKHLKAELTHFKHDRVFTDNSKAVDHIHCSTNIYRI